MIKTLLLVAAVSMDGFAAAVGMGSAGIRIPFRSAVIISFTGTLFLSVSVALAGTARLAVPETVCSAVSFILLIALGIFNLFRNFFKEMIVGSGDRKNNPAMLLFDGTAADKDNSKSISAKEAAVLSIALSADSAVTGISAGLGNISLPLLSAMTFAAGLASMLIGRKLGSIAAKAFDADLGWLCGVVLIILAFIK